MSRTKIVYLIHFDSPLKHASHYLGSALNLNARLAHHRAGTGARLLAVINELGIGWQVVETWAGGRELERKLKNRKNAPKLCPICKANTKANKKSSDKGKKKWPRLADRLAA